MTTKPKRTTPSYPYRRSTQITLTLTKGQHQPGNVFRIDAKQPIVAAPETHWMSVETDIIYKVPTSQPSPTTLDLNMTALPPGAYVLVCDQCVLTTTGAQVSAIAERQNE